MTDRRSMSSDGEGVDWAELTRQLGSRLIEVESPLRSCLADPGGRACSEALTRLSNPFTLEDDPAAFHTAGWFNAFETRHSPRVVAAESAEDVAIAVRFCAERGVPIVIKGTGHDYLGRSSNPDALMVWTHPLREIGVHESFSPYRADLDPPGTPAISLGSGVRWLEAYQALENEGRYVQGGGCTSVGVTGFTLGGGFGSFSRRFGSAAGNLLEAEVVIASGETLVTNAHSHPELFWALRGGGFGFGVVTRLTMRTHEPPATLAAVGGTVRAGTADSFRRLVHRLIEIFPALCDDHWGEQVRFLADDSVELALTAADVTGEEAASLWEPFLAWVLDHPDDYRSDVFVVSAPFESFWDPKTWDALAPEMIHRHQDRNQPTDLFWWASNQGEISQYLHAYESHWIPVPLMTESSGRLAEALFEGTRHWRVALHFNKALCGAAPAALERERSTSLNPSVFEAAALAISASSEQYAFPGIPGRGPDFDMATRQARRVKMAMAPIRAMAGGAGSYVNETDYFETSWQDAFWGQNYPHLLEVKHRYDPDNVFRTHHAVGSEA